MRNTFSFALILFSLFCHAQAPAILWQKTYGGNSTEKLNSILVNPDSSIFVGGRSTSPISGDKTISVTGSNNREFWILNINDNGEIISQISSVLSQPQYYSYAFPYTSFRFFDNKFYIGTTPLDYDVYEMNVNYIDISTGASYIGFDPGYNGGCTIEYVSSNCGLTDFFKSTDGTYICSGTNSSACSFYSYDYFLEKKSNLITSSFVYSKHYGGSGNDVLTNSIQTNDTGFLLFGYSNSNISGIKTENSNGGNDFWLIKTDSHGDVIWQNTIGGNGSEESVSVAQTSDGGYIIGGSSNSTISGDKTENSIGGYDYWVLKLDATGTILWQKTIGGDLDDKLTKVLPTNDNGYILIGTSSSSIFGDKSEDSRGLKDNWIVKLNNSGSIVWDKTIGGSDDDIANDIIQTNDGGYIIGSTSTSSVSGDKSEDSKGLSDFWLLKLDAESLNTIENNFSNEIQLSPNPTNGILSITIENQYETITSTILNVLGQKIKTEEYNTTKSFQINLDTASGIYFIELKNQDNQKAIFKIIKN